MLSPARLILKSIAHYWRIQAAVAAATAIGVAVLAGSLLVGASVQESLRALVLERLGPVDQALIGEIFFNDELVEDIRTEAGEDIRAVGLGVQQGAVSHAETGALSSDVQVLGVDDRFWSFMQESQLQGQPGSFGSILNAGLAAEIGASEGQEVLLRVRKPSIVGQETLLGERQDVNATLRLDVEKVLPDEGVGRFALQPTQRDTRTIFVPLSRLQDSIDRSGRSNTILFQTTNGSTREDAQALIEQNWKLDDVGLSVEAVAMSGGTPYLLLQTRRIFISPTQMQAATRAAEEMDMRAFPTLTYIVNTTRVGDKSLPYSTFAGVDNITPETTGPQPGEIFLNQWAADDLGAQVGDDVGLTYFVSDRIGNLSEETTTMTLARVVAMETPWLDEDLTPDFPGLADADSMGEWDAPFPVDLGRIRSQDDAYWEQYRATPKGFLSLEDAKKMWGNRYGDYSSLRIFPKESSELSQKADAFHSKLRSTLSAVEAGLALRPVKQQGLQASKGSSSFGGLFIGFSLFLLLSAVMLVQILYRIGVMSRAREIGLLGAVGISAGGVRKIFLLEGAVVALVGSLFGAVLGSLYAAVMTHGLNTWWVDSIGSPFVRLSLSPSAVVGGMLGGWFVAMISIFIAMRRLSKLSPALLLAGEREEENARAYKGLVAPLVCAVSLLAGAGLVIAGPLVSAHMQATLFFSGAGCLLVACLSGFYVWLRRGPGGTPEGFKLRRVAAQGASRDPGRSLLVAGLMASATFLIVAVGANRHNPSGSLERASGTGGYELMAESATPLPGDLEDILSDRGWAQEELDKIEAFSFRLRPGGDASCLNLYQVSEPRVLGASDVFVDRGGFVFSSSIAESAVEEQNPWTLIEQEDGEFLPAVADYTTAYWLLKLGLGDTIEVGDHPIGMAAFLQKSVLQSELILSQDNFEDAYPDISGWAFFMIDTPDGEAQQWAERLESDLSDYGFDAIRTVERLEELSKVENTYLATFQSLGGLGLLLGTVGLAFVLLRNILEPRRELAMLRAVGFRKSSLVALAAGENILLLIVGLGSGILCAFVALAPVLLQRSVTPDWLGLAIVLALSFLAGLLATLLCAWLAIRGNLLSALRNE